jgi:hypothetical protein
MPCHPHLQLHENRDVWLEYTAYSFGRPGTAGICPKSKDAAGDAERNAVRETTRKINSAASGLESRNLDRAEDVTGRLDDPKVDCCTLWLLLALSAGRR